MPGVNYMEAAVGLVLMERKSQNRKWGDQSSKSMLRWMTVLVEEVGEACNEINEALDFGHETVSQMSSGARSQLLGELTQVAAVAVEMMERVLQSTPQSEAYPPALDCTL